MEAVASLLKDEDVQVRAAAAIALNRLGARQRVDVGAWLAQLHEGGARDCATAAWALGELGAREHAGAIAGLLDEPHPSVRYAAAGALARLKATEHAKAIEALRRDPNDDVRRAAAEALKQLESPGNAEGRR
jgi:HEAT repeat protein